MSEITKEQRGSANSTVQWIWQLTLDRLRAALLLGLCGGAVAFGSALSSGISLSTASADPAATAPQAPAPGPAVQATVNASPLDAPLALVAEARQTYQRVHDYTCTLVSQERVKGKLEPEYIMAMKFRQQPFSVYLRWLTPRDLAGQEVCYVEGRNNNKMRVHPTGAASMFGFVTIDPSDPRVLEHSNHTIREAGIGNLIERFGRDWAQERQLGRTAVTLAEYEYNQRRCVRVEAVHTEPGPAFPTYRSVVYFEKESRLPIRVEVYDWPRQGGPAGGDLLECFSYVDVQFNVGLTDVVFNK